MKGLAHNLQGPIANGTIRTSFVLGLRLVVQAGTLLLVARMLGPQQFGAFAGIAALAVILGTLSTFGTHLVLLGEVSKDPARREDVLPYALPFTLLCGSVLFAIYLLICTFVLSETGISIDVLLAIGSSETLLQPLFGLVTAEHLALGRTARSQLLKILPLALRFAAAAAVLLLHPANPLLVFGYGYLLASLLAFIIATLTMPSPWPGLGRWRLPKLGELHKAAGYAALNITAAGPFELDKTLATRLLPLAAAGVYAAGARVIGATTLPVMAMLLSIVPRLFREGQNQPTRTRRLLRLAFVAAIAYGIGAALILWFAAPVFEWIFGARYHRLDQTLRWLTFAIPGMTLRLTAGNALMALGKPWMRVGFEAAGLAVLVIAAAMFAARYPTIGMPLALACSEWVMAALGIVLVIFSRQARWRKQIP